MDFEIKLPLFIGPFDLLLFFIDRDEIDIYDIPISKITDDFLKYLQEMEEMNIELASEFILVAATLMRIKARLLIPKENTQTDDPRKELVDFLLEYRRFKTITPIFEQLESEQLSKFKRGNILNETFEIAQQHEVEFELHKLDLYKLMTVYQKLWEKFEDRPRDTTHTIVPHPFSLQGQKEYLLNKLKSLKKKVSFTEMIGDYTKNTKLAAIYNFLAILELLQMHLIVLTIDEGYNNFWIESVEDATEINIQNTIAY